MLLAMILLQLHGVKFPGGFHDPLQHHNKKKRQRTSPDQLAILEQIFQTDKMPSQQTRVQLADQLGMSSRRVQIWFQNKRAKVKRGISKSSEVSVCFFICSLCIYLGFWFFLCFYFRYALHPTPSRTPLVPLCMVITNVIADWTPGCNGHVPGSARRTRPRPLFLLWHLGAIIPHRS
jgi:hypothetical protein